MVKKNLVSKKTISKTLITGFWHGDSLVSINMQIGIMLKLLKGVFTGNDTYSYMIENREIWFIPIINMDALSYMEDAYNK